MLSCHYEKYLYSFSPQGVHCGFHVIVLPLHILLSYYQLKYNADNAKLREIFSLAGKVADVANDKDGKSREFGFVEMNHPVEAFSGNAFQLNKFVALANTSFTVTQALSLFDNRTLYDRLMFMQMDREAIRGDAAQSELSEVRRSIECEKHKRLLLQSRLCCERKFYSTVLPIVSFFSNTIGIGVSTWMICCDAGFFC
jgi:RNA recognition motif. (a.k.a. RRM, RBD, or RNP domain)